VKLKDNSSCDLDIFEDDPETYPKRITMIDKAPDEPEFPNEYYEEALLALVTALPPGELISDTDLTEKHGLVPQVWLDVALALMAEGEPVVIEEIEDMQGWQFGLLE
jgi:hypothetical protein